MKLPGFLKWFSDSGTDAEVGSGADSKSLGSTAFTTGERGTFKDALGSDVKMLEDADRKVLYAEDKMRTVEQEKVVLEKEKQGLVQELDSQLQQCDSLKKENISLEERLYAVNYKNSDENFAVGSNLYEKGQLSSSRNRGADLEHDSNWLLPYSDFMTLLLVVFIVFYGLALTDVAKLNDITTTIAKNFSGGEAAVYVERKQPLMRVIKVSGGDLETETQPEVVDELRKEILSSFRKFNLGENLFVNVTKTGVTIGLSDRITFYPGQSTLRFTSGKLLHQIGKVLSDYPGRKVVIEGHTDNIPISSTGFKSNWELSSSRAVSLVRYFVDVERVSPDRFAAMGFGQFRPVASNSTAEGRAANRRVEIKILME